MATKYQNELTRLSIIIESNDIDAQAISDANGKAPNLTDQQHKKLRPMLASHGCMATIYHTTILIWSTYTVISVSKLNSSLVECDSKLNSSLVKNFERKTRDYMRLFLKLARGVKPDGPLSYKELEDKRKHMNTYRSHRNVAEIEREFIIAV
jgi:hypothetical protein